jgi:EmrB/QacA subfamily drug resistance transporter
VLDRKWMVLSNTSLAVLMTSLDASTIVIALPTIGKSLASTSALDIVWMLLGYQLVLGSVLVNVGRFADILGRARLYKIGYIALTVGSALCSIAQTGDQLVLFRFLQGGGAALIQANSTALILDAFPAKERGRALGINSMSLSSGMILGLVLGGFLTTALGWRSIFWINIPIGIFSIAWSQLSLKELRKLPGRPKIDVVGNLTFLSALAMFLSGVSFYALRLIDFVTFVTLVVGGGVAFGAFVYTELHVKVPMLNLSLFRVRPFAVGNVISIINNLGRGTIQLVLTFYLQGPTMGLSALLAGFYLLPNAVATIIAGPLSGVLSDRYGYRQFTLVGTILGSIGALLLAQVGPKTSYVDFAIPLLINGFGGGLYQTPNRAQVVGAVPPAERGVATGVYMTFNNVGGLMSRGVTFFVMGLVLPAAVLQAIFAGSNVAGNPAIWSGEFISAMHVVFYFAAALTLVAAALCFLWFIGMIQDKIEDEEETVATKVEPGPLPIVRSGEAPANHGDSEMKEGEPETTGESAGAP